MLVIETAEKTEKANSQITALVPYWLDEDPLLSFSNHSPNRWWFEPLNEFDNIVLIGPNLTSSHSSVFSQAKLYTYSTGTFNINLTEIVEIIRKDLLLEQSNQILVWHVIQCGLKFNLKGKVDSNTTVTGCIGDLHHMSNPITFCREIVSKFKYDYLLLTHTQYAQFFEIDGIYRLGRNILPFPVCSSLLISNANKNIANKQERKSAIKPVIFGKCMKSPTHPFREIISQFTMTSRLAHSNEERLSFASWIEEVAKCKAVLTCSLNGSYSLQTLAPLANGSLLITDRISTSNHIGKELVSGSNCLIYDSPETLAKIIHTLENNTNESNSDAIRLKGKELYSSLLKKQVNIGLHRNSPKEHTNRTAITSTNFLTSSKITELTEIVQELQRISLRLVILLRADKFEDHSRLTSALNILPRLKVYLLRQESLFYYLQAFGLNPTKYDEAIIHCRTFKNPGYHSSEYLQTHSLRIQEGFNAKDSIASYSKLETSTGYPMWIQSTERFKLIYSNLNKN
jgi:hypothetical protein